MPKNTLLETPYTGHEIISISEHSSDEYVNSALYKHDVVDIEGISRPTYVINGREVVFRTRQEAPIYEDSDVFIPGGEQVYPLEREVWDDTSETATRITDESAVRAYVDAHQKNAPRIVVTNTPEGMLEAAAILVETDEESHRLHELAVAFAKGDTWNEDQRKVVDTMLAAVSVDDQGKLRANLDMTGWPLALAALCGDKTAELMVDAKRQGLVDAERERATDPNLVKKVVERQAEQGIEGVELIPLEQLALVHSTSYDIQHDKDGNIILRTAGQQRDDRYPRASLHFTLNSRVGDVTTNSQQQKWSDVNKLIVANLKSVVDASHTLPNRMAGMDTWFTINPGEALKLPGALIVEQVEQTANGMPIEETESGVRYAIKDMLNEDDNSFLKKLYIEYGTSSIKDIALRIAMNRLGVPVDLMDSASTDGNRMFSGMMDERINATAISLGLPSGKHFETPEANMELESYFNMPRMIGKLAINPDYNWSTIYMDSYPDTAIEARRQALKSGFYPARPNVLDEEKLDRDEMIGAA